MNKDSYESRILSSEIDKYGTAEEEYVTKEHLDAYNTFVKDVQGKFNLKTEEEAQAKAQELIRAYHSKEEDNMGM